MEVLKLEPERQGFQHLPRGPADVNVSEKHGWLLLCRKTFFRLKTLEKLLQKVLFTCTYNGAEKHITYELLKTLRPGQRLMSSLLCTLLMMMSVFMTAPECLFVKLQSCALTAPELPC